MWDDLTGRLWWRGSERSRYQEITAGSAGRSKGCGHFGADKAADSEEMQKTRRVTETDQDGEMMRVCGKRRNRSLGTQMVWPVQRTTRRPPPGCFWSVASTCGHCRPVCTEACACPQGRARALADQHPVCPGAGVVCKCKAEKPPRRAAQVLLGRECPHQRPRAVWFPSCECPGQAHPQRQSGFVVARGWGTGGRWGPQGCVSV